MPTPIFTDLDSSQELTQLGLHVHFGIDQQALQAQQCIHHDLKQVDTPLLISSPIKRKVEESTHKEVN